MYCICYCCKCWITVYCSLCFGIVRVFTNIPMCMCAWTLAHISVASSHTRTRGNPYCLWWQHSSMDICTRIRIQLYTHKFTLWAAHMVTVRVIIIVWKCCQWNKGKLVPSQSTTARALGVLHRFAAVVFTSRAAAAIAYINTRCKGVLTHSIVPGYDGHWRPLASIGFCDVVMLISLGLFSSHFIGHMPMPPIL